MQGRQLRVSPAAPLSGEELRSGSSGQRLEGKVEAQETSTDYVLYLSAGRQSQEKAALGLLEGSGLRV